MSNSDESSRQSPEERRAQIIDIAAAHFSRDGIAGASMSAIATDAGVTRALVYHYFPGKERLLEAVLQREANRVLIATQPDTSLSQRENLDRALTAFFDHFEASSGGIRELYSPTSSTASTAAALAAANHTIQVERLLSATGTENSAQTRLLMGAWLAMVEYTARHAIDQPGVSRDELRTMCVVALEGLLGHNLPSS